VTGGDQAAHAEAVAAVVSDWRTDWRTGPARRFPTSPLHKVKTPDLRGFLMRLNGVEPSRPVRGTRPSTLRVYQFRHSRGRKAILDVCAQEALSVAGVRVARYACEQMFERFAVRGFDLEGRAWSWI
jgi:hypothetical protein